jgi:UDPglucose 6-dehydrogenase
MNSTDRKNLTVAVIGLGKLGAPMAAAIAARGFAVLAADLDATKVQMVNRGVPPVTETQLGEYLERARGRLRATADVAEAAAGAGLIFVIVPTPSEPHGGFSLRHVLPACDVIGRAIKHRNDYPTVVITSTVMPGSTGGAIREHLEAASGLKSGAQFGLCYSPEFIALGTVIHDFLNPDLVLIGESDGRSGDLLENFYREVCENVAHVARMNHINAEISKLAVNAFVTTKIAFANMLAEICEGLPGANVDAVTSAIGHDTRIGLKYLRGAVSYGGPCFPRDNLAMGKVARDAGVVAVLPEATDETNRNGIRRLLAKVKEHYRPGLQVGILGLAYKPNTDVIEESPGLLLAQALLEEDVDLVVFDPMGMAAAQVVLGDRPAYAGSTRDCLERADLVVIMTPWREFSEASRPEGPAKIVIDGWRIASEELQRSAAPYIPLGVSPVSGRLPEA